jgi:hypothetical protein
VPGVRLREVVSVALGLDWDILVLPEVPVAFTLRVEASYESSVAEAFGNLPSSAAYLSPAFLKAEPSSMNFRC